MTLPSDEQEREWRRQELAIQAAQLGERVRQLEAMFRDSERRIMERHEESRQRLEKSMVEGEQRIEAAIVRAVKSLNDGLEERVTQLEFRPYKLISWILGGAVLIAAVPSLAQHLLPLLMKLVIR